MPWTTPGTATAGDVLTASFWNTNVRDNLNNVGMIVIASTTVTSSSALIAFNNVFTSTYRNYRVVFDFTTTANADMKVQMRSGGVAASGANDYKWSRYFWTGTTSPTNNGGSSAGQSNAQFATATTGAAGVTGYYDIFRPALAQRTIWLGIQQYTTLAEGSIIVHDVSTAYDGFGVTPNDTITGKITVYAYQEYV